MQPGKTKLKIQTHKVIHYKEYLNYNKWGKTRIYNILK